jgi:Family of unknown function (DUF5675)
MELTLVRTQKTELSTISHLLDEDKHECFIIEDTDRGLKSTMSLEEIQKLKIHGKTAIPEGRYQVVIAFSPRFKRLLPRLLNVPGYDGVLIHIGNYPRDTEGCLLPGTIPTKDCVLHSTTAFNNLYKKLLSVPKDQEIWITIKST